MKPSGHRVLLLGILSPVFALILYALVYGVLTRFSHLLVALKTHNHVVILLGPPTRKFPGLKNETWASRETASPFQDRIQ
jgi:hypothetical protein